MECETFRGPATRPFGELDGIPCPIPVIILCGCTSLHLILAFWRGSRSHHLVRADPRLPQLFGCPCAQATSAGATFPCIRCAMHLEPAMMTLQAFPQPTMAGQCPQLTGRWGVKDPLPRARICATVPRPLTESSVSSSLAFWGNPSFAWPLPGIEPMLPPVQGILGVHILVDVDDSRCCDTENAVFKFRKQDVLPLGNTATGLRTLDGLGTHLGSALVRLASVELGNDSDAFALFSIWMN